MTMNNRLIAAVIAAAVVIYLVVSSIYIVNPRQQAVVMRFGRITSVQTQPGLYFKIPTTLVDTVQVVENRLLRYDIANMTLQVKGGKFYEVDAFLTYRITDPRLFREKALGNLQLVESRIGTRFDAALRQVYGLREFSAALSAERTAMMMEVRNLIRPDMADLGVDIVDVRILRTDLTQQVSAQTYDRMKAERLAEAALLRANGQQASQSLKAIADRQSVEILADARRDSDILRGQGEGQRSTVYANAYNVDPEFFEFYRSLQAYATALKGNNTTMVLSPDSDFFRYFGANSDTNTGNMPPPGAAAAVTAPDIALPATTSDPATDNQPTPSPTGTALPAPITDMDALPPDPLATKVPSTTTPSPAAASPTATPPGAPAK